MHGNAASKAAAAAVDSQYPQHLMPHRGRVSRDRGAFSRSGYATSTHVRSVPYVQFRTMDTSMSNTRTGLPQGSSCVVSRAVGPSAWWEDALEPLPLPLPLFCFHVRRFHTRARVETRQLQSSRFLGSVCAVAAALRSAIRFGGDRSGLNVLAP